MRLVKHRVKKVRERFTKRRLVKRQVVESVKRGDSRDSRLFAEVSIEGKQIAGLLDTSASVSILGRGSREFLAEIKVPVKRYVSSVRTASGVDRSIIGRVHTRVTYGEKEEDMTFYICPYLEQQAYFGIDFWRVFGLAPDVLGSMEAQISEESKPNLVEAIEHYVEEKTLEPEVDVWELNEEQKSRLETVKAEFLSFENAGLGKTTAQTHKIALVEGAIPVKDRHYTLSPAMEEVVCGEVDKMLALGVIEESDRSVTLSPSRTLIHFHPSRGYFSSGL
ncbi:GH23452 [Drosophila grimshawi]|uniref:GH23452 n=1 Tax=Drosophila grimshawi TaxID=7222 RepID=B4K0A1_DROGR|nr:GH23452 [Drosophila grimshawi]